MSGFAREGSTSVHIANFIAYAIFLAFTDLHTHATMSTSHRERDLSRRERQIMDLLYRFGRLSVAQVLEGLPDAPSYSAVRALLKILETKGHVRHEEEGRMYIYMPIARRVDVRQSALSHLLKTFFDNSAEQAVAALLALRAEKMSGAELDRMSQLINDAKDRAWIAAPRDGNVR
ncbi:MAG: transcriptional repressor, CopY family [Gemmatimonadetes bacterium]|nr:transcriptional repressor, CopY family [Gemmatimonadota bacterium]